MAKKDAMGTEVDSLYLSLGLNVADLELGFETAGKTVKQAMSRLNSEANQIRLKADIDVTRLEAAGKSVEALKAREKALNDELAIQQKKLELLNRAYEANSKTYGKDSALTRGVDTKRLYQVRDIERLKAQIAQVNGELAKTATASTSALGTLVNGFGNVQGKVNGVVGSIGKMNAAITGAVAAVSAGAGIFALTDKAMMAGENLYKLSTRLNMTQAEASKLSKVLQLSGTDVNTIIPIFARLGKQVLAGAKTQNSLTQAMAEFGFTLTDNKGNLLNQNQALMQLAKGYQNAVKTGREMEFVTQVLGAKGAALVPVLQDLFTNMEIVDRIKGTGLLNKDEAHQLYIEWQAMQMQAGQLTGAIGQALMPIAKELMPEITKGFSEFAQQIKDNKDSIKEFGSTAGSAIGGLASTVNELIILFGKLKGAIDDVGASSADLEFLKKQNPFADPLLTLGKGAGGLAGAIGGFRAGGWKGAIVGAYGSAAGVEELYGGLGKLAYGREEFEYLKQKEELKKQEAEAVKKFAEQKKQQLEEEKQAVGESVKLEKEAAKIKEELQDNLAKATSEKLKEQLDAIKDKVQASVDQGKTEAAAWVSVADDIQKAMKAAAKEAQEANKALTRSINSMSMSDLGKSLYGVETAAEDTLKKGADPALVAKEAMLKKSKIVEQHEKEVAEYLDNIYADSLTKRLNQIEREKNAWIKKGMDEVTATRAAEAQKQQAVNDSIKNMFTSQKKYLDIYRQAMRGQTMGNSGMYDFTQSQGDRQQNAIRAMRAAMMQEVGVNPWERTSMAEVQGFQRAMKAANEWGSSLLKDGGGMTNVANAITQSNSEVTNILGQISPEVSQANSNLSSILTAIQSRQNATPQITVSPSISVDLGGAYVFDNAMKKQLADDITNQVSTAVTDAVRDATNRVNTSFSN